MSGPGQKVRVGLIGAGGFGRYTAHIVARQAELELAGVADIDARAAHALGQAHAVPWWDDPVKLLADCACDAVAVVTPHNTHHNLVLAAARHGRHIFCEKTMAMNVAECHAMIDAAAAHGVKLMVGHKRRFRPPYAEMKRLLLTGAFGRPLAINVAGFFGRRIQGFWKDRAACGGLLYWAGVHDVDTLRHLLGEVAEVYAVIGPKLHPEVSDQEDSIVVHLRFANGAVGTLQVSTHFPMATYRTGFGYQIVCERGGIGYDPRQVAVTAQLQGQPPEVVFFEGHNADAAYDVEWSSFAAWILRAEPPVLTGVDGLRCVEILQAAYIAADTGAPVRLPLARDERRPGWW